MKTIDKILTHNFSEFEEACLLESGIANGCGGKGGVDFDEIIAQNLRLIPKYDPKKKKKFFVDLKRICIEHDLDFRMKLGFYKSNFVFAKKVYKLMRSAKVEWVNRKQAFGIAGIIFVLLTRYGKKFYNSK